MKVEICVESVRSALNAYEGGATRIELCSALYLGGLTPSLALFKVTKNLLPSECKIFVMIRPKPGNDFVYDEREIEVMAEDIRIFRENGADGFVFGCLTGQKTVDVDACKKLLESAKGHPCTFHRAFDEVENPEETLVTVGNLGFARILTSGQQSNAHLGRYLIRKLVDAVGELKLDVIIVAGGGIDVNNLADILNYTKVVEFHGSAKARIQADFDRGKQFWDADASVVREMIEIAKRQS